jgi:hypothetical protein
MDRKAFSETVAHLKSILDYAEDSYFYPGDAKTSLDDWASDVLAAWNDSRDQEEADNEPENEREEDE